MTLWKMNLFLSQSVPYYKLKTQLFSRLDANVIKSWCHKFNEVVGAIEALPVF